MTAYRRFAPPGAIVLAAGFVVGVSFLVSAHDGSLSHHDISAAADASASAEGAFLAENDAAMRTMMSGMAVKPTGDVDADFVAIMVPHHQGAIDMAVAVLRYGRNVQIRRLAQEIIVTQQEEIAAMRLAVGQALPASVSAPTQVSPGDHFHSKSSRRTYSIMEP